MADVSRRAFLVGAAGATAAGAVGATGFVAGRHEADGQPNAVPVVAVGGAVPFHGMHQAGIATEQQDRLLFAAYDVTADSRTDLIALLRDWTVAADRMTRGLGAGPTEPGSYAPPTDTGEAIGLDAAKLTLTFGFGPALFGREGRDRFALASNRPEPLADLPAFPGDALDPERSGGDLCVQACCNDPQVAYHAIRNLTRIGRGRVTLRWVQQGFGRTSSTAAGQETPRNLMGFKDGTNNLIAGAPGFDRTVWVAETADPAWMRNGSYLVVRRIRMHIEVWDRNSLTDQEQTFGRLRGSGAPLGRQSEHDPIDLHARTSDGAPLVPRDAHVRLANQKAKGISILRRGYSFTDGIDKRTGRLDAGLFFLAYQADPHKQFVPLQTALAHGDALNEYIQHVGSALFAIPPGVADRGGFVGDSLLG